MTNGRLYDRVPVTVWYWYIPGRLGTRYQGNIMVVRSTWYTRYTSNEERFVSPYHIFVHATSSWSETTTTAFVLLRSRNCSYTCTMSTRMNNPVTGILTVNYRVPERVSPVETPGGRKWHSTRYLVPPLVPAVNHLNTFLDSS